MHSHAELSIGNRLLQLANVAVHLPLVGPELKPTMVANMVHLVLLQLQVLLELVEWELQQPQVAVLVAAATAVAPTQACIGATRGPLRLLPVAEQELSPALQIMMWNMSFVS